MKYIIAFLLSLLAAYLISLIGDGAKEFVIGIVAVIIGEIALGVLIYEK